MTRLIAGLLFAGGLTVLVVVAMARGARLADDNLADPGDLRRWPR